LVENGIRQHLAERNVELGGLLIGSVYDVDSTGRFIVSIEKFVRSDSAESTGVSLKMDTHVWSDARVAASEGQTVVGWYHSHPGLGVFFSGTDRKTQKAFFNHDHCVGLVIDPVRGQQKWFMGGESMSVPDHHVTFFEAKQRALATLPEAPGRPPTLLS
jgi:hypothetical protein